MTAFMIITQAIGVLGMIACFVSFQINKKTSILLFQLCSQALFSVHYFFLSLQGEPALSGALIDICNILKLVAFFLIDTDRIKFNRGLVVAFATILNTIFVAFTWEGWICVLPLVGAFLDTLSFAFKKPSTVRKIFITCIPFWFVYNILTKAWPGLLSGAFAFISLIVAFVRFDIMKKPENVVKTNENEQA